MTMILAMAEALRLSVLFKLVLATLLGGAIGLEREVAGKPAGLRTNILICVGSAMFTQLSFELARPAGDPTRITAQIITGIGFLGAGAILHGGAAVVGLTTAATIWVVAAIGVAIGAGIYIDALGATVLIMIVLVGLRPLEMRLRAKRRHLRATLRVKPGISFDTFAKVIEQTGVHIASSRSFEHDTDRTFELDLIGATNQCDILADKIRQRPDVISFTTE